MPIHNFTLYEVNNDYYSLEDGQILSQTTLAISDTDNLLHSSPTTDPATDQLFSIGGGSYTANYDIEYQDFSVINGAATEYEIYAFVVEPGTASERYYVFSKDSGFNPSVGDDLTVSRYSSFTNTNYADIGSAICFAAGSLIRTPSGQCPVEDLRVGDLVCTAQDGPQPIMWQGHRHVSAAQFAAHPGLLPVVLRPGLCGNDSDLVVSQQHGVSTRHIAQLNKAFPDHLVRAKHLAMYCKGARLARGARKIDYYHLLLPAHHLIWANGVLSESLRIAPMSLRILGQPKIIDLFQTRPDLKRGILRHLDHMAEPAVRPALAGAQIRHATRQTDRVWPRSGPSYGPSYGPKPHSASRGLKCAAAQPIT